MVVTRLLPRLLFRVAQAAVAHLALILGTRRLTLAQLNLTQLALLEHLGRLAPEAAAVMVDRAALLALAATSLRPCNMGMVAAAAQAAPHLTLVVVAVLDLLVLEVMGLEPQQARLEPMVGLLAALAVVERNQI